MLENNNSNLSKSTVLFLVCLIHIVIVYTINHQKPIKSNTSKTVTIELFTIPRSINSIEKTKPAQQPVQKKIVKPIFKKPLISTPIKENTKPITPKIEDTTTSSVSNNTSNSAKKLYIAPTNDKTIQIPKALFNPKPPYPGEAFDKKQEGTVILDIKVTKNGRIKDVKIYKSSGYTLLDESALETVKIWIFDPYSIDQANDFQWIRIPINFNIVKN
ncbi:TonB family protein [Ferrovum sp. PN-J185]|uniref:energy transducer TonB n=1 Tax=Ferrovum sp. PN-J185 TaxID=1356306 RepID=UPI000797490E|nr:energy transducer TonB [Ferrovum sp. PN-J185]KXW55249.1 transport protein TonB [Ferrovum sp. PN-J185]MCC6068064.1 TonB family protein [Ferrovum sp. PN-J185]